MSEINSNSVISWNAWLKSILLQLRLKDKDSGDKFVHEFEDGTKRMELYIKARLFLEKLSEN